MSDEIKVGQKTVTVRQLDMGEINDYLEGKSEPPTLADLLLERDVPERAVRLATGLTTEEINAKGVLPSELKELWNKVEEKNPFLAGLLQRLMKAGAEMVSGMDKALTGQDSEKSAAGSQEKATTPE